LLYMETDTPKTTIPDRGAIEKTTTLTKNPAKDYHFREGIKHLPTTPVFFSKCQKIAFRVAYRVAQKKRGFNENSLKP